MLYTIMPLEMIFAEEIEASEEENVNGVTMVWRKDPAGEKYLSRVVSSNLQDYLKYSIR